MAISPQRIFFWFISPGKTNFDRVLILPIFKELIWLVFCVGLLWIKTALLVLPISDCKQHQISEIHYWNVHPFPGCKGYDFSLRPYEWGSSPNCIPWEGWRADINFLMQTLFAQLTKMVQSLRRQLIRLDAWISAQNPQNSRDMQIMSSKIQSGSHFCPILLPGSWVYAMEHFIAISSFVWVDFSTRIAKCRTELTFKLPPSPHASQLPIPFKL